MNKKEDSKVIEVEEVKKAMEKKEKEKVDLTKLPIKVKLWHIQQELKAPKSQLNKFGGYKYRSLEDILEAVKPLLAKYGLILTFVDNIELIGERYYLTTLAQLESVDGNDISVRNGVAVKAYARESLVKKGMDESQITGAASSYARKYALNALFAIDDTKDADTQNNKDDITLKEMSKDKRDKIIETIKKIAPKDFEINLDMTYFEAKKAYEMFSRKGK